jgi:hypothetical protein
MLRLSEAKLFPIKHYVSFWHAGGVAEATDERNDLQGDTMKVSLVGAIGVTDQVI